MASYEDALARVPGLAGYLAQEQFTQRQNAGQMQMLGQATTLQKHFAEQQRERGLREALSRLGPEATDDDRIRAVTPYVGADKMFGAIEGRMGRQATAANTREIAMARLAQQAGQFARTATNAEQRTAVDTWYKRGASAIAQGRAFHELPEDIYKAAGIGANGPAPTAPAAAPQQAPAQPQPTFPPAQPVQPRARRSGDPAPIRFTEEEDAANAAELQSPESVAELERELARKDLSPRARAILEAERSRISQAAPASADATQTPTTPAALVTGAPDAANLDSRDLVARQGAPVARGETPPAQGAPVARGVVPQVPQAQMDEWIKLHGRKRAGMLAAQWQAAQMRAQVSGTNRDVPGDFTKSGAEYLASLPESDRQLVKKIASYDVDPKTLETRGGQRSRMLSMVTQFDPTYDDTQYANKRRAIAQFGSGPQGNTVRSVNVAIEHMDTLQRAADAMKNGSFTPGNKAYNEVAKLFGATPPNTFEAMRDIVANEVVKGTIGTAGALEDRSQAAAKIKASASPQQFKELINGWTELMGGQVKGLERQYEGATKLKDFRERYLTQRAIDAISLAERKAGGGSAAPQGALQMLRSNPTVPMKEAFKKKYGYLPDGI